MKLILLLAMYALYLTTAHADEKVWQSNVELGFVQTGGNTQTKTLNTKAKAVHHAEKIRTTIEGSAFNSSNQNTTTSEKYAASLQVDWKTSQLSYVFGRIAADSDRFTGIRSRFSETVGYGRDLIHDDIIHWKAELGVGARQSVFIVFPRTNDMVGRLSTGIQWTVSDSTLLSQELNTEGGKEGFVSHSVTALQQKISDALSSKISFSAEHTSKVPVGIKKMNTETAVTLVWNY
ncbi:MAG: DUF481 domain-containing protein [Mariprofundaceae bacterium]|nr:DUF481 domain-containing protein [Mariprofundaceae bacterium]